MDFSQEGWAAVSDVALGSGRDAWLAIGFVLATVALLARIISVLRENWETGGTGARRWLPVRPSTGHGPSLLAPGRVMPFLPPQHGLPIGYQPGAPNDAPSDARPGPKAGGVPAWVEAASAPARAAPKPVPKFETGAGRLDVAAAQMRVVSAHGFERKPLLNREEHRLLPILDRAATEAGAGHRVMAQIALGEAIRPARGAPDEALSAIVAKRLDFGIFDRRGMLVCAVEYQGTGHYHEHSALRDAVKREALRKAGVRLLEVHPDFVESTLVRSVLDLIGGTAGAAEQAPPPGRSLGPQT